MTPHPIGMNSRILYIPREEKRGRRNLKKRELSLRFVVPFLVLVILLVVGVLFRLPYWQVKDIKITGLEASGVDALRREIFEFLKGNYALVVPRRLIFFVDGGELTRYLLEEFPKFAEVKVVAHLPDTLHVIVAERKFFGIFCNDLREKDLPEEIGETAPPLCAYIDRNGMAYEYAPVFSGTLIMKIRSDRPDFVVPSPLLDVAFIQKMELLASELKEVIGEDTVGFELFSKIPSEVRLITASGFRLWWKFDGDFSHAISILKTILDEEIKEKRSRLEYVDLRFGNKVFYKFKPRAQ